MRMDGWKVESVLSFAPRTQKNRPAKKHGTNAWRLVTTTTMAYPRRTGRPVGPAWKLLVVVGSEAPLVILRLSLGSSPALLWASSTSD